MSAIHYEKGDPKENEVKPIEEIIRRLPSHCLVCTNVYTTLEFKNGKPVRPEIDVLIFGKKVYLIDLANHFAPVIRANGWVSGGRNEKCKRDVLENWTKSLKGKFQEWCMRNEVDEALFRYVGFKGYVALTHRGVRPTFAPGQEFKEKQVKKLDLVLSEIISNEVAPGPTDLDIIKRYVDAEIAPVKDNPELPPSRQDFVVSTDKKTEFWNEGWLSKDGTRRFRFRKHKAYNSTDLNRKNAESCLEQLRTAKGDHNLSHKSIVVFDVEEEDPTLDIIWHLFNFKEGDQRIIDWTNRDAVRGTQERLKVVRELLEALVKIHGAGIVHRNINSKSVWIRSSDGSPYLTDFELGFSPGPSRVTVGVQQYSDMKWWAPEAFTEPDLLREPASDCFSFGLLCSFILSGRDLPDEEMRMRGEWMPGIPHDLDEEYPGLQGWLQKLCLVDPAHRATAVDSLSALERILSRPTPTHRIGDLDLGMLIENRYRITGFPEFSHSSHFRITYARDESLTRDVVLKFAVDDDCAVVELQKENDRIEGLRQASDSGDVSGLLLPDMEARISRNIETGKKFLVRKFWRSDLEDSTPLDYPVWFDCTRNLLRGLASLGELGWAIRDITPNNLLISDGKPVLIDVGSALPLEEVEGRGGEFEGNAEYLPHYLLENNEPNVLLAGKRKNLLPRDLFAALLTSYFWLERRHPWAALRADESIQPLSIDREDLSAEQRRNLDAFFMRWLGTTSVQAWKTHNIQVNDVLDEFMSLSEQSTSSTSWVINPEGKILWFKTEADPLRDPPDGHLMKVAALDSEHRPYFIYFCNESDEDSVLDLDQHLSALRELQRSSVDTWEFNELSQSDVRYLIVKCEEGYSGPQDEENLSAVCRAILRQLNQLNNDGRSVDAFGFTLQGSSPRWLPPILANPNEPRGIAAVRAVLISQFRNVEDVPLQYQDLLDWLEEKSVQPSTTSWRDDYDRLEWEEVGEFLREHLKDGTGPFWELGYAPEGQFLAKGRSGSVYSVRAFNEESVVVKIVHSKQVTRTEWIREGERIRKALNFNSENLARPQTPDLEHPGHFVFHTIHGNTLKQRWDDDNFHEPSSLAKKASRFSSQVHQLSDQWGVHCTDLHPSNIMFNSDADQWVLIDYGEGFGRGFVPPEYLSGGDRDPCRCMVYSLALILLEELLRPVKEDRLLMPLRNAASGQDYTTGDSLFGSENGLDELDREEYWEELHLAIQRRMEQTNEYGQSRCEEISTRVRDVFRVALDPVPNRRYPNIKEFTRGLNDLLSSP